MDSRADLLVWAVHSYEWRRMNYGDVNPQAALSKAIKSLNDLVVRRYWAWSVEFGFARQEQHSLAVGDTVFIVDQGEELVRVLYDQSHVGDVDPAGSALLRSTLFLSPDAQNVTAATVHSLETLTANFRVVLDDPNA